jgi:hypothetical protein
MMGQSWFYAELWAPKGHEAKWFGRLPDIGSVRSLILGARSVQTGEIIRVIAHDASLKELRELLDLGCVPQ